MSELKTWVVTGHNTEPQEVEASCYDQALLLAYYSTGKTDGMKINAMKDWGFEATEKPREVTVSAEDLEWAVNALRSFVDMHTDEARYYCLKNQGIDPVSYADERIKRLKEALGK